jgi:hypothetical protein
MEESKSIISSKHEPRLHPTTENESGVSLLFGLNRSILIAPRRNGEMTHRPRIGSSLSKPKLWILSDETAGTDGKILSRDARGLAAYPENIAHHPVTDQSSSNVLDAHPYIIVLQCSSRSVYRQCNLDDLVLMGQPSECARRDILMLMMTMTIAWLMLLLGRFLPSRKLKGRSWKYGIR